jgi:hypothetical protein
MSSSLFPGSIKHKITNPTLARDHPKPGDPKFAINGISDDENHQEGFEKQTADK